MNKKVISLVLALVMVLGTFTSVFAAEKTQEPAKKDAKKVEETKKEAPKAGEKVEKIVGKDNKIQYIIDKKYVKGYEDGSMGYDKNITRAEITRLLVLANGNEELAKSLQGSMKIYSDVDAKHWANGVISVGTTRPSDANKIAMLAGYPDKSFKPDQNVTYAELAKMLVVLVKKDLTEDMVKNAKWATSWLTWAAELKILEDVTIADSNAFATRADAFTMVYNALFAMKEFKSVPNNEVRGIISELNKDKLILNEDSKKEYKINADTVFVEGQGTNRTQIVKLWDVKAKKLYLGSLVRVLVNDKNEVTHILQLGNPEELAANNDPATVNKDNTVWRGVAESTIETVYNKDVVTLTDSKAYDYFDRNAKSYATVSLKDNYSTAKSITFHGIKDAKDGKVTLKVTDKTEVYVANPYNNQMRKLNNITDALSLIGFRSYDKEYKIPNVYAGFDVDGGRKAYGLSANDVATAKVVVFNTVSKDKGGELYRVLNSSRLNFKDTLEKTNGDLVDRNNVADTNNFAYNFGDHLDIIETRSIRTAYNNAIKLDHDDYRKYPVVEVTSNDGKFITVVDKAYNGKPAGEAILDIREADIFSAKRFDKLTVGSKIQFVADDNNVASIVSILERDTALEGYLDTTNVKVSDRFDVFGTISNITAKDSEFPIISGYFARNKFDARDGRSYGEFRVSKENARALESYIGKEVKFKAFADRGYDKYRANDFYFLNADGKWEMIKAVSSAVEAYTKAVDAYNTKKAALGAITEANVEELDTLLTKVKEAQGNLSTKDVKELPAKYIVTASPLKFVLDIKKEEDDVLKVAKGNKQARAELNAKIKEAKELKAKVEQNEETDPAKIEKDKKVANTAAHNALNAAITAAETVANDSSKAKSDLDGAKSKLITAIGNFNTATKTGTKAN